MFGTIENLFGLVTLLVSLVAILSERTSKDADRFGDDQRAMFRS